MNRTAQGNDAITVHSYSDYRNTVVVPNATAQDSRLSWAARGLLTFMLSMPPEWRFHEADLVGRSPAGRDHLRSLVRELEAQDYLRRTPQFDARRRKIGSLWEVWARPIPGGDQPAAADHEQPLTENPSMEPPTENPSVDRSQSQQGICPSTENPSVDPPANNAPLTGFPPTENPSVYKNNKEQKPHKPPSSSLRSEEPPPPGGTTRKTRRSASGNRRAKPQASPEAGSSPSKAPEPASAGDDSQEPKQAPSRAKKAAAALPAFAEPVRPLLEDWWRLRRQRHRAPATNGLGSRSINALALANELGVLQQFAELAAESGWVSLGFNGYREYIAKLADDQQPDRLESRHSGFRTLRSNTRATSRQSAAADRAIALFSGLDNPAPLSPVQPLSCSRQSNSSTPSVASLNPSRSTKQSASEVSPSRGVLSPLMPSAS